MAIFLFFCSIILSFFWLLLAAMPSAAAGAANDSVLAAGRDACVSLVLQDFYKNTSLQAQMSNSPCNSKNKSAGVFWLEKSTYNISKEQLIAKHLRIGVPITNGFFEFMKVEYNSKGKAVPSGFPIDVFQAVIGTLPYKVTYEYIAFPRNDSPPGYYNRLVSQVHKQVFDAVVGDVAITAARSDMVQFTYQYMDGGVRLIVPTTSDGAVSAWWFMKPLTPILWLTTLAFATLKGILVWFFEHEINPEFQGPPSVVIGKIISFSISTLVFAQHDRLESNYSRFIVNLWIFLVFILVAAFAANLTSMLTVDKLQPTITDLETLLANGDKVGYQKGSFVFDLLQSEGFPPSKLIPYSTIKQYVDGLELGSSRGGVSAIMDEIPYIRVFLKHHCRKYTMTGRTYRTGGFGFVFPRGSAMVHDMSRAVMNFTEGEDMYNLEKKWLGDETTCPDAGSPISNQSLPLHSLRSIYIMVGVASAIAFFIFLFCRFYKRRTMRNASNISMITRESNEATEAVEAINTNVTTPISECPVIQLNENQPKNDEDEAIGES